MSEQPTPDTPSEPPSDPTAETGRPRTDVPSGPKPASKRVPSSSPGVNAQAVAVPLIAGLILTAVAFVSSRSLPLLLLMIAVTVIGAAAAAAVSSRAARAAIAPLKELHAETLAASGTFPEFARALATGSDQLPTLPTVAVDSNAMAGDVADSINEIQRHAAALAVTQVRLRAQDAERFVDLGQRSEQLLIHQMNLIDSMQQEETDSVSLQRLFRIDHLASRMRRTASSTLVLAGRDTPRLMQQPVPVHQVVQAASSGVEHFDRITMADLSTVAVNGAVAADLAHMLSELLANATASAPNATTDVTGTPTPAGYLIEIVDHGAGMAPHDHAVANAAFADPERLGSGAAAPAHIGFAVVARLANRHGIQVQVTETAGGGVTAQVHLPQVVLARVPKRTAPQPEPAATYTEPAAPPVQPSAPLLEATAPTSAIPADGTDVPVIDEPLVMADAIHHTEPDIADPFAAARQDFSPVSVLGEPEPFAHPAEPVASTVSAEPAPTPAIDPDPGDPGDAGDAAVAELAERWRVLAEGQRAAIEWAMDMGDRAPAARAATLADLESPTPVAQRRTGV